MDAVVGADVDEHRAPPVRGIVAHDASGFELPKNTLLPAERLAELRVFAPGILDLHELLAEFLVFLPELVNLIEQCVAGGNGLPDLTSQLLGGTGDSEKRQENAADGEF